MLIPAYIIAAAIPALVLYIIYSRDLYKTGAFRFVALSFIAGVGVFFLAAKINTLVLNLNLLNREGVIRYSAPVVEELLKSLILLYLVRRIDFTYFVDGAIYGFAAGIGFAIIENFSYISAAQNAALGVAISRVISTNLVHATASAVVGIGLGLARYERGWKKLVFGLGGYLIAILLHSFFNNMVTRVSGG
ncbi:MAG TPA: PrsW family glutamic-type intramembrane protease, partial [Anaerolineaceae bacterium]|nr:PrsW family glutamic-type intramembrane protease [Anaerolineaceae bacterium]